MYSLYYSKILKGIKELFKSTPIFSVLTTYVSDKERNERVILRNLQAEKNAKELGISVIDLYSVSEANKHLISSDGVHYTKEGYEKFADKLLSDIKIIL